MSDAIIDQIEAKHLKTDLPDIQVGDTVDMHLRIVEGDKERVQVFSGVVIKVTGKGINRMVTVRRIVANEGVERVLPLHSPRLSKIEIKRRGHVRRARLHYLRDRVGKARRLRDRQRGLKHDIEVPGEADHVEPPEPMVAQSAETQEQPAETNGEAKA